VQRRVRHDEQNRGTGCRRGDQHQRQIDDPGLGGHGAVWFGWFGLLGLLGLLGLSGLFGLFGLFGLSGLFGLFGLFGLSGWFGNGLLFPSTGASVSTQDPCRPEFLPRFFFRFR
jgi:hypothetical protein